MSPPKRIGKQRFRHGHGDVIMYWLALNKLSTLNLHKKIVLGAELSATSLQAYELISTILFSPIGIAKVKGA